MRKRFVSLIILVTLSMKLLHGKLPDKMMEDVFDKGIKVDMLEPIYTDGVLTTDQGGVVEGPNIRIQACHIKYIRRKQELRLEAEGDLMIQFGDQLFIGSRIEYDFATQTGTIYNGRTGSHPWYFGGGVITLCPNGDYTIKEGFITTSENYKTEWQITADEARIHNRCLLNASNVHFRFGRIPVFWLPKFKTNLNSIFDSPIHYTAKWGHHQGTRLGIAYEIINWNRLKTFLRVDYRDKRGFGGGLETRYKYRNLQIRTINYVARDQSIIDPDKKTRYRFQGYYRHIFDDCKTSIKLTYDKLSDKEMPTDYNDKTLTIKSATRTELRIRRQEYYWIGNALARLRINDFQTINQELPTIKFNALPLQLGNTGIISENRIKGSNLDFQYADEEPELHDYSATRIEYYHNSYRPFHYRNFSLLPEVGVVSIFYSNSPGSDEKWLTTALFQCTANTHFHRQYLYSKHIIEPYVKYSYYTSPSTSVNDIYIFDIDDGWNRLNILRYGIKQNLIIKDSCGYPHRVLDADLYSNAFFDTPTIPNTVQKVYLKTTWYTTSYLKYILETGWDFQHGKIDQFNLRTEWTHSENLAIAAEYRHRSPFHWRKMDHNNYILDSFRTISELVDSSVSDRRDTFLLHAFWRFHPNWSLDAISRQGWNRKTQPSYLEFQVDLNTHIRSAWNLKFSYQHKESDKRIGLYLSLGLPRPDPQRIECPIPLIQ